ncbi:MAG: sulfatase-like hydrolase/transferase, partial [Pseudomonadota bacterium]
CLYNLRRYPYQKVIYRSVYSPTLHFARNLEVGRGYQRMINEDAAHFAALNRFGGLTLRDAPNIVFVCIESYGGVVYTQPALRARLAPAIERFDSQRQAAGLHVASVLSEAPLFTGGSWLSYTTFTYGLRIDNLVLYDRLFAPDSAFAAYESVFHVLRRNGYRNHLLGPLGGVAAHDVDWDRIQRNFQADVMIDFDGLDYAGPTLPYMGLAHRFAPPDQYALNAAYERARASGAPFSLFFLTLNSHFPFDAPAAKVDDWRALNDQDLSLDIDQSAESDTTSRYVAAMRYELDVVTDFVADHAADDTVFVVFGDHQPPFVATDDMGVTTPVHILSRDAELVAQFVDGGYVDGLAPETDNTTRHEDFMPLFLDAMARRYGHTPEEPS